MNLGSAANAASNAAGNAASNAATKAAGNAASNAASNAAGNAASNATSNATSNAATNAVPNVASNDLKKAENIADAKDNASAPSINLGREATKSSGIAYENGSNNPISDLIGPKSPDRQLAPKLKEATPPVDPNTRPDISTNRGTLGQPSEGFDDTPTGGDIEPEQTTSLDDANISPENRNINSEEPIQETKDGKKVFQDENGQEFKEGDKVEPGKEVDENGQVKDSSTKKLTKVAGQAAAAYFTGGESLGADQQVMNMPVVDNAIGVVADTAEKVPGVSEVADELDEAGVTDAVGDALNLAGDIKNGDIGSAADNAEKVKEDLDKTKKYATKKIVKALIISMLPTLIFIIVVLAVLGPVVGGFIDITEKIGETIDGIVEGIGDFFDDLFGGNAPEFAITEWVSDFNSLSYEKQRIVTAAAALVGRKYQWGGKPTGAGLSGVPSTGLDCSGYVQWVLWTAYGINPGMLSTGVIADLANKGDRFKIVSADELEPGDIGLVHMGASSQNHTGIYAGDGYWFHAANSSAGIIRSKYSEFTVYLRYVSDTPLGVTGDVANWRQYDSNWGSINMGNSGKTIKGIGCLVTSIAIQIARSGVNNPIIPFNPGTFVQALNRNGGFTSGGGLYWGTVSKVVPNFVYMGQVSLSGKSKEGKLQTISSYLSQGYYVVVEVKGNTGQHWVAVVSTSSSGVTMIDPASNSNDMWGQYNWANTSALSYFKAN